MLILIFSNLFNLLSQKFFKFCFVNSNFQYKELTSGFDLNNALGRYRSSNNDVIASLINAPSNFYNSGEITIDWFPAGDNNTFGVQIMRGRYANTTYQYIRSKARNEWRSWEQFALKSDLGNTGNSKIVSIDVSNLDNPPNSFILQTIASNTIPGFPTSLSGNRVLVLQLLPGDSVYSAQLAFGFGSGKIAMRNKQNGNAWSSWTIIGS